MRKSSSCGGESMAEGTGEEVSEARATAMVGMKASLKLRNGDGQHQRPLLKAKLPLHVCGLPLCTSIVVGQKQELALRIGASQSLEFAYRFNSPHPPFNLVIKSDLGFWFSSASAALAMAAEFNLSSPSSPSFRLSLQTDAGDFSFRRDFHSSNLQQSLPREENPIAVERNVAASDAGFTNIFASTNSQQDDREDDRLPPYTRDLFARNRRIDENWEHLGDTMSISRSSSTVSQQLRNGEETQLQDRSFSNASKSWGIRGLLAGSHLCARSRLRISNKSQLKVRWRMQIPSNSANTFPLLPLLMVDKVSVELLGPPVIVQGISWLPSFWKLPGIGPKTMENTGTDSKLGQKPGIDHPVQGVEVKQTPLWYLNRKSLLD